jgi:8-amino-7-oxononanoate synthase
MKPLSLAEPLQQIDRTHVLYRGRKLIYFGGCDYFRLAHDRHVLLAAAKALKAGMLNVAASRITTGNHPLYGQLEAALCVFFKVQSALLTSTGYTANLVTAQAFAGQFSHALIDERAHPSLKDAVHFLDCPVLEYKHRDPLHATQTVARCGRQAKVVLLTDGVFGQDGTLAPLPELLKILPRDATLLLDDAHGAGVLGKRGRGTAEHFSIRDKRIVTTITLSKAFGTYGGAVLGSRSLCNIIVARSNLFGGSTPPPLPFATAACAALATVSASDVMRARLQRNMKLVGRDAPILSVMPRNAGEATRLKKSLLHAGIFPTLIRYPGSPPNGYFRFAVSSEHTPDQIQRLLATLNQ